MQDQDFQRLSSYSRQQQQLESIEKRKDGKQLKKHEARKADEVIYSNYINGIPYTQTCKQLNISHQAYYYRRNKLLEKDDVEDYRKNQTKLWLARKELHYVQANAKFRETGDPKWLQLMENNIDSVFDRLNPRLLVQANILNQTQNNTLTQNKVSIDSIIKALAPEKVENQCLKK